MVKLVPSETACASTKLIMAREHGLFYSFLSTFFELYMCNMIQLFMSSILNQHAIMSKAIIQVHDFYDFVFFLLELRYAKMC